jgi:phytoene dehydrogenase-like protein
MRSAELTLPGFTHDICAAVVPLALASPFFRTLPLAKHGLAYIHPDAPLAHPLDDGTAVILERSVEQTAAGLRRDGTSYAKLFGALVRDWSKLEPLLLGALKFPKHPLVAARFGLNALLPAATLAKWKFRDVRARALFAGLAAHSVLPLESSPSAAIGLVIGILAHASGWPIVRGGTQKLADALAAHLRSLGAEIHTDSRVTNIDELPPNATVLCDVSPRQLVAMAGLRFTSSFRSALEHYRYSPGVCKVDWALDAPVPWKSRECSRAGTVHIGGTLEEIAASERAAWNGIESTAPFVLLAQPTLFDSSRAPAGKHTVWAYCHVPNGSTKDMSSAIEAQIERFAPGFRDRILARACRSPRDFEQHNANYVGGDVVTGSNDPLQLVFRPRAALDPYSTGIPGVYLCSAATPPGAGAHGMCGYNAAQSALRRLRPDAGASAPAARHHPVGIA